MFKLIQELFSLLTPLQRRRFFILQVLVVIMAVIEIIGIASILPFMALVGDMSLITQQIYLAEIYQMSGVNSESEFIFLLGAVVLIMLFISASVSMYTVWKWLLNWVRLVPQMQMNAKLHSNMALRQM